MSQLELQTIAHLLSGAASANTPDKTRTYVLYTQGSSIISKEWTGKTFTNQTNVVEDGVRPDSTAAYVLGNSVEAVIYIDSSSMLHITEFDEESDEWYEDPDKAILHKAHPSSHVAACLNNHNDILVIYHNGSFLAAFTVAHPTSIIEVPVNCSSDSALFTLLVDDTIYVFYISFSDRCLHYATQRNIQSPWFDTKWSIQPLNGTAKRFIVNAMGAEGTACRFEAYVLTDTAKLLQVSADGHCSDLGRIDENGSFVSEGAVNIGGIEAQDNTPTAEIERHVLHVEAPYVEAPAMLRVSADVRYPDLERVDEDAPFVSEGAVNIGGIEAPGQHTHCRD